MVEHRPRETGGSLHPAWEGKGQTRERLESCLENQQLDSMAILPLAPLDILYPYLAQN